MQSNEPSKRLPLPACFKSISSSNFEESVESTEDGKIRTYPHVRGQWTTFPHAEVPIDLIDDILSTLQTRPGIEPLSPENIHLSLVRGHFTLRHHQIQPFVNELGRKLRKLSAFRVCLSIVRLFSNDQATRYFVCLCEWSGNIDSDIHKSSRRIVKLMEETLDLFGARVKSAESKSCPEDDHDNFIFHTSIARCLPDHKRGALDLVEKLNESLREAIVVRVDRVKVKIGNQMHVIPLEGT